MKKEHVYINVDHVDLVDTKPPRNLRPKCLKCDRSIPMSPSWWYDGSEGYGKGKPKYYYSGIGYFCSRNCAIQYGIEAARKALGHPEFNTVK